MCEACMNPDSWRATVQWIPEGSQMAGPLTSAPFLYGTMEVALQHTDESMSEVGIELKPKPTLCGTDKHYMVAYGFRPGRKDQLPEFVVYVHQQRYNPADIAARVNQRAADERILRELELQLATTAPEDTPE